MIGSYKFVVEKPEDIGDTKFKAFKILEDGTVELRSNLKLAHIVSPPQNSLNRVILGRCSRSPRLTTAQIVENVAISGSQQTQATLG